MSALKAKKNFAGNYQYSGVSTSGLVIDANISKGEGSQADCWMLSAEVGTYGQKGWEQISGQFYSKREAYECLLQAISRLF